MSQLPETFFTPSAKILVIDDSLLNRMFVVNAFPMPNFNSVAASDGFEGIRMAQEFQPELILLDVMMPGMDGFQAAAQLKADPLTADIPIIFITALDALNDKLHAFDTGAVDYITKPFNHKELLARVKTHVRLRRAIFAQSELTRIAMEERRHHSVARIAAGVSHNFNNMLGVAVGNIMLIETLLEDKLDDMCRDSFSDVKKSFARMQHLLKQFLVISQENNSRFKSNPIKPEPINLLEVVSEALDNISAEKCEPQSNYNLHIPPQLEILCTQSHIHEIFNLIINEIIDTTAGTAQFIISAEKSESSVSCSLIISGIPVRADVADTLFEPFSLTITNVGSGLSFAVAKQLIILNHGKVAAKYISETSFEMTLSFPTPTPES